MSNFEVINADNGKIIKAWMKGVPFDEKAIAQLKNTAQLPFIYKWLAAMPDAHWGTGSTVGTVLPTLGAIVPAAVGVDIGCGMIAEQTGFKRDDPKFKDLAEIRAALERAVPAGRTNNGQEGDRGAWHNIPADIKEVWEAKFATRYKDVTDKYPGARAYNTVNHLGTLGTGNHFLELSTDKEDNVWIVLHSGSRGLGNKIGSFFTELAQNLCGKWYVKLPDPDLAYLPRGTDEFEDYTRAVKLAQEFAWENRIQMMKRVRLVLGVVEDPSLVKAHCHHNYISWEHHFGKDVMVTRKGAVRARKDDLAIIPGSMGAATFIAKGLENPDSFHTCSHGAGRAMSRGQAVKTFSLEDHAKATEGVECLKDASVLDETPGAYKDIEAVMAAQSDLVTPIARLKQFVCVKGADRKDRKR